MHTQPLADEVLGRRAIVPALALAMALASASFAGGVAIDAQSAPPTRPQPTEAQLAAQRAAIEERLAVLTDEALDLLARVEFPVAGEPEPTDEQRARARAVQMALLSRFGLIAPVPDDDPRRVMAAAFVRLSPDQAAVFDADMEQFDAETSPAYVRELRRARRQLDDLAVASIRLELDGARPMSAPGSSELNARVSQMITELGMRHADERAARIQAHADFLASEQTDAFGLLAEAVRQEHLQRLLRWDLPGAAFDVAHELALFLAEHQRTASGEDFAPLRRQLAALLPLRGAAIIAAVRAKERMSAASVAFMDLIEAGVPVPADDPARERYTRARERQVDAVIPLVEINESLVDLVEMHLDEELGRAFRSRFMVQTTPWVEDIWPHEWDAVRAAGAGAGDALTPGIAEAMTVSDTLVADAVGGLRTAFTDWRADFRRAGGYDPRTLPALHQRFADQYLESQRAIEGAVDAVHGAVAAAADEDPALVPLRERLAEQLSIASAARVQAEELAEAGEIPWCRGLIIGSLRRGPVWRRAR